MDKSVFGIKSAVVSFLLISFLSFGSAQADFSGEIVFANLDNR